MNRKKCNSLQLSGSFLFSSYQNQETRQHPYRATQMWHRSIEIFLTGIPLSLHRPKTKFWKAYESSFSGSEAVNWFSEQLCSEFDPGITKGQTKLLLNKFFKAGVFKLAEEESESDEFKEGLIYRLTMERKPKPEDSIKSTPSKMKKNYSIEIKPLTNEQIEAVYFTKLCEKLRTVLDDITEILPHSPHLRTNLLQTSNQVPSWLLCAMKVLTDFPKRSENHCDYPNFINDVYKLVSDYFQANSTRIGLLIENTLFFKSIFLKLNNYTTAAASASRSISKSKYQSKFPFPKSEFEEIDRIFTPKKASPDQQLQSQPQRFVFGRRRQLDYSMDQSFQNQNQNQSFQNQSFQILDTSMQFQPMSIYDSNRYKTGVYFETGFVNSSPITRVVSQRDLRCYENPSLSLSPADLINHPKYSSIRGRISRSRSHADLLAEKQKTPPQPLVIRNTNLIEAVALFLLTLEPVKRQHLEVLLRFMDKISKNSLLCLDVAMRNEDIMFNTFSPLISHDNVTAARFLVENVESLFKGEFVDDFKSEVEEHLKTLQIKKIPLKENKENVSSSTSVDSLVNNYCSKISMVEYEDQRLLGETAKCLRDLLDAICAVKDEKIKKKQLKKFEKEYPHIYAEKFRTLQQILNSSGIVQQSIDLPNLSNNQQRTASANKRTPFGVLI